MSNAPKNLLGIVQAAQAELGLNLTNPITSVIGNTTDATTVQMLYLLNQAGEELRDTPEQGWTAMQVQDNLVVNTPLITTGNVSLNSPVITNLASVAGLTANAWVCTGTSLPVAARVISVGTNTVTLDMEATGNAINTALTFAQDTYTLPADFNYQISKTWWD